MDAVFLLPSIRVPFLRASRLPGEVGSPSLLGQSAFPRSPPPRRLSSRAVGQRGAAGGLGKGLLPAGGPGVRGMQRWGGGCRPPCARLLCASGPRLQQQGHAAQGV